MFQISLEPNFEEPLRERYPKSEQIQYLILFEEGWGELEYWRPRKTLILIFNGVFKKKRERREKLEQIGIGKL